MHCKDISVRSVDVPLTEDGIASLMESWDAYVRTEYLVLRNDGYAVLRLRKAAGDSLFRRVEGYDIVSLPDDTVFLKDERIDVLNIPALAALQSEHSGKTVVIEGMFSHIGIVSELSPLRLRVVDVTPPNPSKLSVLVRTALASGFVNLPIVAEAVETDLMELSSEVNGPVMFPCRASGLSSPYPTYFLDEAPGDPGDVTLIGCVLSKRIFCSLYGRNAPFVNMCPVDGIKDDGVRTLARCCRVREGFEIDGNIAKVPWGVTVPEIVDALKALFSE
ncbi:MAG: hypothetical protein LBS92_04090 [Candidatus Methanoplasma sp.]|jgi:hypothetical protein|nr:hypothetical protein [Candidatus Methanoplasma sp.]